MCKDSIIRNIIAISQRVDVYNDRGELRDSLDTRLPQWLSAAGLITVSVPNFLTEAALRDWLKEISPQGIILSGGNDIGEIPERDSTEKILLEHAQKSLLPVLGICRGMQMMCVHSGGSLKSVIGHVKTHHSLDGNFNGKKVNSYHNQTIDQLPDEYDVMAKSEDGEIEAIRHKKLPWQGWMWHPERETDYLHSDDLKLLKVLFSHEI